MVPRYSDARGKVSGKSFWGGGGENGLPFFFLPRVVAWFLLPAAAAAVLRMDTKIDDDNGHGGAQVDHGRGGGLSGTDRWMDGWIDWCTYRPAHPPVHVHPTHR